MEDAAMKDTSSQAGSGSATGGSGAVDPLADNGKEVQQEGSNEIAEEEMINFVFQAIPIVQLGDLRRDCPSKMMHNPLCCGPH